MPPLRRPGRGEHAGLSLVRLRQSIARLGNDNAGRLSAVRAWREDGLGLLRLVLWPGICGRDPSLLCGQTLHRQVCQPPLPATHDAIHALLSLVPYKNAEAVEACEQQKNLSRVQLGDRE